MSDPFYGEIRIFGFNYPPVDWATCNGASVPVNQNQALFALLAYQFGGVLNQSFQLPNLANRMLCGSGAGAGLTPTPIGQAFGANPVTLTPGTMPAHSHVVNTWIDGTLSAAPTSTSALGYATKNGSNLYTAASEDVYIDATSPAGGNQPHENRQPMLAMNFCICTSGIWPAPAD